MKNPMKSSVDSSDVPVDNPIGTVSELSIHAGCADVPMIDPKAPMCARVRVCAHENIGTIGTSAHTTIHAGFSVPIHKNIGTTSEQRLVPESSSSLSWSATGKWLENFRDCPTVIKSGANGRALHGHGCVVQRAHP